MLVVDWVDAHWREPDEGIWEVRRPAAQFCPLPRLMAPVTVDRMARAIEDLGLKNGPSSTSSRCAPNSRQVFMKDTTPRRAIRTHRYYGSTQLDAALLLIPMVDSSALDPRVVGPSRPWRRARAGQVS